MSDELDKIREQRMRELQQAQSQQDITQVKYQQEKENQRIQKENILRKILTDNARIRLGNVKMVKLQIAEAVENQLIHLYQSGRLASNVNEEQLLYMLKQLQSGKRESTIKFKRV